MNEISYTLNTIYSSIKFLKKNNFKSNIKLNTSKTKIKLLHNLPKTTKLVLNYPELNNRDILKILYTINFENIISNDVTNRNQINSILILKKQIKSYLENKVNCPTLINSYNQTMIIDTIYKLYKLQEFK